MSETGQHFVPLSEVLADGLGFGWGLYDDEFHVGSGWRCRGWASEGHRGMIVSERGRVSM